MEPTASPRLSGRLVTTAARWGGAFSGGMRRRRARKDKIRMVAKSGTDAGVRWKLAPALTKLVSQLDAAVPGRNRVSDGSIASHQHHINNPRSDHEPHQFGGGEFVTALDITHDTEKGINCHYLWDSLLISEDPRIKYVIFNRRIFNSPPFVSHTAGARARGAWNPGKYDGSSPHTHHLHLSVWGDKATETGNWKLPTSLTSPDREAHLKRLGQAKDIVDKQDPKAGERMRAADYTKKITDTAEGIKAGEITPLDDWLEKMEDSLQAAGADPHSLTYALRFYRELAGRIGFDGSKPEKVANWVYGHINSLQIAVGELKGEK